MLTRIFGAEYRRMILRSLYQRLVEATGQLISVRLTPARIAEERFPHEVISAVQCRSCLLHTERIDVG